MPPAPIVHSRTVPSALPAASVVPAGLNASAYTVPAGPVSGWPSWTGRDGRATFHSCTASPAPATASTVPSGLNAAA